jgi:phosphate transport system permease protein
MTIMERLAPSVRVLAPAASNERPPRRSRAGAGREAVLVAGPLTSSFAALWLLFHVVGLSAPFGFLVCFGLLFLVEYSALCWRVFGPVVAKDHVATAAIWAGSTVALVPLALIIATTFSKGLAIVLRDFPRFLDTDAARFNSYSLKSTGGVEQAIIGTVEQVGLAGLITVPLSVLTALYLHNATGRTAGLIRALIDAMTSIPTIVASLIIYFIWVVPRHSQGKSGFAVALALAIIMAPTVAAAAEAVLRVVPSSLREASYALGASEWRTVLRVVVPTARAGLISAMILGIARAVGETAPALFTSGDNPNVNLNPFHNLQSDLPLRIFELHNEAGGPVAIPVQWATACVLVGLVLVLFFAARVVGAGSPLRRLRSWRVARSSALAENPLIYPRES